MRHQPKLLSPDESIPGQYKISLIVLGIIGLIQAISVLCFTVFSWDFFFICFAFAPWGFTILVVNVMTYLACRRLYTKRAISRSVAKYVAVGTLIVNGLPVILGYLAQILGLILGASNNLWVAETPILELIFGSAAMLIYFYPFNLLGVLGSFFVILQINRVSDWDYEI